jgi:hypothetical protein
MTATRTTLDVATALVKLAGLDAAIVASFFVIHLGSSPFGM